AGEASVGGLKSAEVEGAGGIVQLVVRWCQVQNEKALVIRQSLDSCRGVDGHLCRIDIVVIGRTALQANELIPLRNVQGVDGVLDTCLANLRSDRLELVAGHGLRGIGERNACCVEQMLVIPHY